MAAKDLREVTSYLEQLGCTDIVIRRNKHYRFDFKHFGVPHHVNVSSTPSDRNHLIIVRQKIRTLLGVPHPGHARRRGASRAMNGPGVRKVPPPPECVSVGAPWQYQLLAHPTIDLSARLDRAWLEFWAACMASVGARTLLLESPPS